MKNNSKQAWTIRCLLSVALMFFFSIGMFAQSITVKGVVKDDAGEPIIGASVVVKGHPMVPLLISTVTLSCRMYLKTTTSKFRSLVM